MTFAVWFKSLNIHGCLCISRLCCRPTMWWPTRSTVTRHWGWPPHPHHHTWTETPQTAPTETWTWRMSPGFAWSSFRRTLTSPWCVDRKHTHYLYLNYKMLKNLVVDLILTVFLRNLWVMYYLSSATSSFPSDSRSVSYRVLLWKWTSSTTVLWPESCMVEWFIDKVHIHIRIPYTTHAYLIGTFSHSFSQSDKIFTLNMINYRVHKVGRAIIVGSE